MAGVSWRKGGAQLLLELGRHRLVAQAVAAQEGEGRVSFTFRVHGHQALVAHQGAGSTGRSAACCPSLCQPLPSPRGRARRRRPSSRSCPRGHSEEIQHHPRLLAHIPDRAAGPARRCSSMWCFVQVAVEAAPGPRGGWGRASRRSGARGRPRVLFPPRTRRESAPRAGSPPALAQAVPQEKRIRHRGSCRCRSQPPGRIDRRAAVKTTTFRVKSTGRPRRSRLPG